MEFLSGRELSEKIKDVMKGANPCMSVAFLSSGWFKLIFEDNIPPELKIICDVEMGCTPRDALKTAGAPDNPNLKYIPDKEMHGKVYISDRGVIVCSANATLAALRFDTRIEDGVWAAEGTPLHQDVQRKFSERFDMAEKVSREILKKTPKKVFGPEYEKAPKDGLPLLQSVLRSPSAFNGVYFVFTGDEIDDEVIENGDAQYEEESDETRVEKKNRDYHYDFGKKVTEENWPKVFIAIHRFKNGRVRFNKLRFLFTARQLANGKSKSLFISEILPASASGSAFGGIPELAQENICRKELREKFRRKDVFSNFAGEILSANQFAEELRKL
ncbi:hypothetical protein [Thioclava sp. GXIMD4215]|uniref:hypothetical protein n=1 Tax=Thioclava sp. GXIMD4215 TaxID=3131928 RepID=UPI00325597DB